MPAKLYPFIDIAVHERVREHFARGDAAVLFATDMGQVLWANGLGAALFGMPSIYDFLDAGVPAFDVAFRQADAAARQLKTTGERRQFLMRITSGFQRVPVNAAVERIGIRGGEEAILFTAPRLGKELSQVACARQMLSGFDDPDTHMAVLDGDGEILAASDGFAALSMTPQTRRALVSAVSRDSDWLVKRPVPTGKGHLPAAIGKLSETPALHLLFAVETILGNLDPGSDFAEQEVVAAEPEDQQETIVETPPVFAPDDEAVAADRLAPAEEEQADVVEPASVEPVALPPEDTPVQVAADGPPTEQAHEPASVDDVMEDVPATDDDARTETSVTAPVGQDEAEAAEPVVPDAGEPAVADDEASDATMPADAAALDFDETYAVPIEAQQANPIEAHLDDMPVLETDDQAEAPSDTADVTEAAAPAEAAALEPVADQAATSPEPGESDAASRTDFVFQPKMRAARFVWKIDANGHFSEISSEFAAAVGPRSADVVGKSFDALAERYGLDGDNTIGALLRRRDTWSGKMILWPVEGTSLAVPVDLAALPTYSRNREFDGFRGFGIVRVADAVEDPIAMGLHIGADQGFETIQNAEATLENTGTSSEEVMPDTSPDTASSGTGDEIDDAVTETTASPLVETEQLDEEPEEIDADLFSSLAKPPAVDADVSDDPFRGERPALKLVDNPGRRTSDKVVQLEDHRSNGSETLTRSEQAAFREIARQLGETFGQRETPPDAVEGAPSASDAVQGESGATDSKRTEAVMSAEKNHNEPDDLSGTVEDDAGDLIDDDDVIVAPLDGALKPSDTSRLTPALLDTLPLALLVHLGDALFHANPEFLKLTGYASLEALEEEGGLDALFAAYDETDIDMPDGAMMLIRTDGQLLPVNARLQSIRWDEQNALMMVLSPAALPAGKDGARMTTAEADIAAVAEDGEAFASLRIEAEELRSILETATDGVVVVGADGDIRSLNRSANALFNYDDGDIRGKPFAMLFAHESQKAVLDYLSGLAGHGVASVLNDGREVIGREASGGFIPLFMTMGRLSSSNGYCAVIRDITQWKRTEEELRNAKRAAETANAHKTDFLARVSHEIRTPLNAIIGFSDMMASEHFGPIGNARYVEYASDIGRSGRHVLDIVNDLLDISKIEAGEMDLEFTAVEINDAVSEAVALVQPQANGQRVIIRTSLSTSVPSVVADSRSIKQMALNILANAIRFTPSGGQIVVSTAYEANGSVILRIRDTGVGMTRAELEQAMKPFRQVTTGVRQRGEGTGLGLPLTKAMAEANRAQFSINSAPNEGTLVEISFPSQRVLAN